MRLSVYVMIGILTASCEDLPEKPIIPTVDYGVVRIKEPLEESSCQFIKGGDGTEYWVPIESCGNHVVLSPQDNAKAQKAIGDWKAYGKAIEKYINQNCYK